MSIESLYSLAYVSRSEIRRSDDEVQAEIADILEVARRNNRLAGITGALLFSEGWFAQVLEGPSEAIENLFETIQGDSRHSKVTILHFHPVNERSFPAWSMAYAGMDDTLVDRLPVLQSLPSLDEIAVESSGRAFVSVLRDYIARQEAD